MKIDFQQGKLKNSLIWIALVSAVLALTILVTMLYYQREHYFYYWDWNGYPSKAYYLVGLLLTHKRMFVHALVDSLAQDYNNYSLLPLLPVLLLLGSERQNYLLAVGVLYQFPFILAIGWIFWLSLRDRNIWFFWIATVCAMLVPNIWKASLRGYPDVVGALCLLIGLGLYLIGPARPTWRRYVAIGFFLAWAAIFRRYYAYGMLSSLLSMSIMLLAEARGRWRVVLNTGIPALAAPIAALVTLSVFDFPMLWNMVHINYNALYSSYLFSFQQVSQYFLDQFGLLLWILAILGYGLAYRFLPVIRHKLGFVVLNAGLFLLVWTGYVRQSGVHYLLVPAAFLAIGLSGLFLFLAARAGRFSRFVLLPLLAAVMAFNFTNSFGLTQMALPNGWQSWFSAKQLPLYRADYDEVVRLIDFLRQQAGPQQWIYVADSSDVMNFEIAYRAEEATYPGDLRLHFFATPQIDSRDFYPLAQLLQADFVVVSEPFQYHLAGGYAKGQNVVKYVYEIFRENTGISQDFEVLPEVFVLNNGRVTLRVYRRIQETSVSTSTASLHEMAAYIQERPAGEPRWIPLQKSNTVSVIDQPDGTQLAVFSPTDLTAQSQSWLLSTRFLTAGGSLRLWLEDIPAESVPVIATVVVLDAQGYEVYVSQAQSLSGAAVEIDYPLPAEAGNYSLALALELAPDATSGAQTQFTLRFAEK